MKTDNIDLIQEARKKTIPNIGWIFLVFLIYLFISGILGLIPIIGGIIQLIIAGSLQLGMVMYIAQLYRGTGKDLGVFFNGFRSIGKALLIYIVKYGYFLLSIMIIGIAAYAFIVQSPENYTIIYSFILANRIYLTLLAIAIILLPGIYLLLLLFPCYYVLMDKPDLSVREVIRESKKLMKGNIGKLLGMLFLFLIVISATAFFTFLFMMITTFILIITIPFFLLVLFVLSMSMMAFYEDLRKASETTQNGDDYITEHLQ